MNRKKIVASAMTLSMATAMLLSACGNTNNNNSNANSKPSSNASETAAATNNGGATDNTGAAVDPSKLPPREISIYFEGPKAQTDTALVEAELNKITKAKINATVKINHLSWGDFPQKMNLMMASGEPFDLMFTAGFDNFTGNVSKGAFVQLDDPNNNLLEKYGQDILKSINPVLLNGGKVDNKLYAIPTQKEMASQYGMLLQKDIVDQYGIDLSSIKKLEDLEPYLLNVKKDHSDMIPIVATSNWLAILPYELVGSQESPGRLPKDGSTKVVNIFEQQDTKDLFKLMEKWYKLGLFQKDPATNTELSAQLKTGLIFATESQLKPGAAEEASINLTKPVVQVPLTPTYTQIGDLNNSMLAISKTSKDPERAMMFLNLLHSDPDVVNLLDFGIEGKHYVKVDGKTTVIKHLDGVETSKIGYSPGNAWQVGNQLLSYTFETENEQKWENYKAFNDSSTPSVLAGFSYNNEPVKNEEAAIAAIWKKYIDALSAGIGNTDDYLNKMNNEMKKAGMDKILQEKQRQIDAFLASKK
ncbi:ABC transporter substrate-binding protein [Paenibacillus glycanilyticus]|uniref:ABC transporter substrate-binding protein n=1 Tax=Paenibacillus glycanilyticus TaxID=126569 RepID=UPI000FD8AB7B|nr:ABC transporter substrate-binding protein [Paenibacillus glycanilyticus]